MTNNIQKAFKTKSKLRAMADGGSVRREIDPAVLGTGGAARAGHQIRGHNRRTAAEIDSLFEPAAAPTPVTAAPAKKPEEKSALRSFFGLADGGQVFKNTVGGVPTFTDARAATAGATAHTPGQGGGTFSVIGMEPAQKQQMADAAAQRQAAANAPTTLGGRLDEALGKLGSPPATAGAPSSTPTLGSELDAAIGRTQGVTSAQTPATGAPANGAGRTMDPQKTQTFSGMSQAAATDAAQMRDIGLQAGQAAAAAARPASPLQSSNFDEPSFELEFADGGKVKGKGGPTEDKVGPVMLSNGEYVLPADTVEIVGRDKLDALRLATHDFVDDSNKPKTSGLRKMVNGGPVYADPEDVANRRLLSAGLGQPPQTAAGSSGGGGRGIVPHQLTATGSPGGGGRGLVPNRPPSTAMVPYEPPVEKLRLQGPGGGGRGYTPYRPPDASWVGGGGGGVLRGLLGKAGLVGNAVAAAPAVNASVGEWARGIPEVLRGESAPQPNTKVRFLDGQPTPEPIFNPTPAELDRRGALRPESVDAAMNNLRAGNAPGGGFQQIPGTDVFRRNNPNAGNPGESAHQYVGVGTPERQTEDPIMGELRSALRGLTDGAGNRGGGFMPASRAREINKRYDDILRDGSGRNRVRGLDWSQRHGLDVERARASELDADQRNRSALRGQDMQAAASANSNRTAALQVAAGMMDRQQKADADAQTAQLKALQDAQEASEGRMEDNVKVFESVADTFAEGDKGKASQYRELLATLPPELHQIAQGLAPEDKRAFYTNIVRQQLGRNDGLVLGRDMWATVQNAAIGGLLGRMTRFAGGAGGKAVDRALGKIPRVGPLLSALRPAENLSRFGTLIGAGAGAYVTPEVENLTRWDPPARDPASGAALPARKDMREAATYGAFDTYFNPFDDSVQTVSGRRTDRPTPDEEEAARRFRSALRN